MRSDVLRINVAKPTHFDDLKIGDSIACNGVCLTLEAFDNRHMQFALAAETLQVTQWTANHLMRSDLNLERSLALGARIHGHLVAGHVDAMGEVVRIKDQEESRFMSVALPESLWPLVWKKGSLTINGVSLTVNNLEQGVVDVWLIPETLARTNLGAAKVGDAVTLEVDMMARALMRYMETRELVLTKN